MGKSRQREHQLFLTWLTETAVSQKVDAIIVAGDIFDTGSPPSYARELYNQFIVRLQSTGIYLIILGGNHDSVATLSESRELLAYLNTFVIPGVMVNPDDQVITLKNAQQEPIAIVCAIPFLRSRDIMFSSAGQSGSEKQKSLQQAISEHYQRIFELAKARRDETGKELPIIATGHLTTVGAKTSESVREIYIGTLDAFPCSAFPAADYIALGHIHRAQKVAGSEHIRYCGSPIPLSFDELKNDKTILIAEFNKGTLTQVMPHIIPRFQPMHLIKGDLHEIEAEINRLAIQYGISQQDQLQQAWLDIEVSTQDFLNDLQQRVQSMVEGLPLEILLLRRERKKQNEGLEQISKETLHELTPGEVFERCLSQEDWSSEAQQEKLKRVKVCFDEMLSEIVSQADENAL
jgi:exonuclease SbcD